jgi:hypothetical protein
VFYKLEDKNPTLNLNYDIRTKLWMIEQFFSSFLPLGTLQMIFNIQRNPPSLKMCTGLKNLTVMYMMFLSWHFKISKCLFIPWFPTESRLGSDGLELWHQGYVAVTSGCGLRKTWRNLCVSYCTVEELGVFLPVYPIGVGCLKFCACCMKHASFIRIEECKIVKQMAFYGK